jgi:plastocyanin
MRIAAAAATVLALPAFAGCGGDGKDYPSTVPFGTKALETIEVTMREYRIEPATIKLDEPGVYTFLITNAGSVEHVFEVEGKGLESEITVVPKETVDWTLRLPVGRYEVVCPLDEHEEKGMEASLIVGKVGPSDDEDEDEEKEGRAYGRDLG